MMKRQLTRFIEQSTLATAPIALHACSIVAITNKPASRPGTHGAICKPRSSQTKHGRECNTFAPGKWFQPDPSSWWIPFLAHAHYPQASPQVRHFCKLLDPANQPPDLTAKKTPRISHRLALFRQFVPSRSRPVAQIHGMLVSRLTFTSKAHQTWSPDRGPVVPRSVGKVAQWSSPGPVPQTHLLVTIL